MTRPDRAADLDELDLAGVDVAAQVDRLLAAAMARRRRSEPARLVSGGLKKAASDKTRFADQASTSAAVSSCGSRRAP